MGQAADDCGGCGLVAAPLAARDLSLLEVEDRPRQEESWLRGPLCGLLAGSCQAVLPWQGEWEQLGPGSRPSPVVLGGPGHLPVVQAPCASVSSQHFWEDLAEAVPELGERLVQVFLGQGWPHTLRASEVFLRSNSSLSPGKRG